MWEFLITLWHRHRGQFRPSLGPKKMFLLFNFTRILGFFWDLGLTQYLWFSSGTLSPKMELNCKLCVSSIYTKVQNFEGFFKHWDCLIGDYLWSKFQQDWAIFGKVRAQKTLKRGHFMDAKSIQKSLTSQPQMLYWWNLPQVYILIRSFIWQNLGV